MGKRILSCFLALLIVAGGPKLDTTHAAEKQKWYNRVTAHLGELLDDEQLPAYERRFAITQSCLALAGAGYVEHARQLAVSQFNNDFERWTALNLIAGEQSENDDVPGALQTANMITDEAARQRAVVLIAARQAQRGDFDDAVTLLNELPPIDPQHAVVPPQPRDRALQLIVEAQLEQGAYQDADKLMGSVASNNLREQLQQLAKRMREQPDIGDADYVERSVAQAKADFSELGFDESTAEFIRRRALAEVALHRNDHDAFQQTTQSLEQWIPSLGEQQHRNALIALGLLYHRGRHESDARRIFGQVMDQFAASANDAFDLVRWGLVENGIMSAIVNVVPFTDLEARVKNLVATDERNDLIGALVAALVNQNKEEQAETIYQACRTTRQRFEVAVAALYHGENIPQR